eukprot:JP447146.1.p2 GENE.JP447146.1~~JP447146.1.p2  ORF type:complete len:211 (+),score=75.04 JP447146.1:14-646(+)
MNMMTTTRLLVCVCALIAVVALPVDFGSSATNDIFAKPSSGLTAGLSDDIGETPVPSSTNTEGAITDVNTSDSKDENEKALDKAAKQLNKAAKHLAKCQADNNDEEGETSDEGEASVPGNSWARANAAMAKVAKALAKCPAFKNEENGQGGEDEGSENGTGDEEDETSDEGEASVPSDDAGQPSDGEPSDEDTAAPPVSGYSSGPASAAW